MTALNVDLFLDKNNKFEYTIQVSGQTDLVGWTARLQIRERRNNLSPLLAEWSTVGTEIVVLGLDNQIQIDVNAAITDTYTWESGYYDLFLYNPASVPYRLLQGIIYVNPNVTV